MCIRDSIWGGPRRVYATLKFFLYTFFGSVFMLIALIYMYNPVSYTHLDVYKRQETGKQVHSWDLKNFCSTSSPSF